MVEKAKNGNGLGQQIAGNDTDEVRVLRPTRLYGDSPWPFSVAVHPRLIADKRAEFAMSCIERWALLAGEVNGEDSAGRSKLRRLTPQEVVTQACECADQAFKAFAERGWLLNIPSAEELADLMKEAENAN